ncbi:MAG: hypothetical protein ACI4F6_05685 [Acutalibacteraceae bacterium]
MSLTFDDVKSLIRNAIENCEALGLCRITDAYPPIQSDSPVKRNICAIGLLSAEMGSCSGLDIVRNTENTVTAYADIYTPVSKGGQYSTDCALELCGALEPLNGGFSVKANVGECIFLSSCYAYKTRVVIAVSQSFTGVYDSEIDGVFTLFFNDESYMCRDAKFELSQELTPIECYGECYPVGFARNGRTFTVKIRRYIFDDDKSLWNLSYPFTVNDMLANGLYLSDCAVIDYQLDRHMQEIVTIMGRNDDDVG